MKVTDFDYDLPKEFIAQDPVSPRDSSKLMVVDTKLGIVKHIVFRDIVDYLGANDVLVLNRSKVLKARIEFDINNVSAEIFLLRELSKNIYRCLVKPGRKFKKGVSFQVGQDTKAEIIDIEDDGVRVVKFHSKGDIEDLGKAPFPPYIAESNSTLDVYQTVYAEEKGSTASPTAGLHFTNNLLGKIKDKDVDIRKILLHVGLGTFLPVRTENIKDHVMHSEFYELGADLAESLTNAKIGEKRIVAVGTTSVRVLESTFEDGKFNPSSGETDIFIYPGYQWKAVDALVTNFHLPKSTLIMLVASFLENKGIKDGTKYLLSLYELAKENNYRFYSFGDAMMII